MASQNPYAGFGSSRGSGLNYLASPKPAKAKAVKSNSHPSLLGDLLGNLKDDIVNTAVGTPAGLLHLVTDPVGTAKAIGAGYAQTYGPALHGHFGTVAHNIEQHPLGPLLDVASLLTGGEGALLKVAPELRVAKTVSRSVTKGGPKTVEVGLASRPSQALRQVAAHKIQEKILPEKTPVIGQRASVTRAAVAHQQHYEAALRVFERDYKKATKGFTPEEATVLDAVTSGVSPRQETQFLRAMHGVKGLPKTTYQRLRNGKMLNLYDETVAARKGVGPLTPQAAKIINAYEEHAKVSGLQRLMLHEIGIKTADPTLRHQIMDETLGNGKMKPQQLASLIEKQTGFEPLHVPDSMIAGAKVAAGRRSKLTLFQKGLRNVQPENLLQANDALAKLAGRTRAEKTLKEMATPLAPGQIAPKGYIYLRGEPGSYTKEQRASFEEEARRMLVNGEDPHDVLRESLVTSKRPTPDKVAYAIPEHVYQDMLGRQIRQVGTMQDMLDKATNTWKRMVLAARPAFVTGNLSGNQILFHLHNGVKIPTLVKARKDIEVLRKYFPEHEQTFGSTERLIGPPKEPELKPKGKVRQAGAKGVEKYDKVANAAYDFVGAHELWLRAATMRSAAMKIPEFKKLLKTHNGNFDKAMRDAVKKKGIHDEISNAIDDTMGNYRYYNRFETGLRRVVPFYGWSRHAIRAYYRLLLNHPALADTLVHLGDLGDQLNQKQFPNVPDFMRSYLKAGGHIIDTRQLNPLSTAGDTTKAIVELATGGRPGARADIVSQANPLLEGLVQQITGTNLLTGAPVKQPKVVGKKVPGAIPGAAVSTLQGTPEYRILDSLLGTGTPSKMISHRPSDLIKNFLGVPEKHIDIKAAQKYQKDLYTKTHPLHKRAQQKAAKAAAAKRAKLNPYGGF